MSNMIQVWTNSLTDKSLLYVASIMEHGSEKSVIFEDGRVKVCHGVAGEEGDAVYGEAAAIPKQEWPEIKKKLLAHFGVVVSIPVALVTMASPVIEPDAESAFTIISPTRAMLAAGADVLPISIDNDEAMRLAGDVFFAMMSRMSLARDAQTDARLEQHAV
ncbi:hypothetical protein [Phytohalomonas tamaricis]|uniref:hypothetical protein n=1 Tax=Phytohalomonas tamaricis TaxID=2081032 RepID=UPI001319C1F2|nr:hypothetical protein [Phytohalomonas tamaricis]